MTERRTTVCPASITCPHCGLLSYHSRDIMERYCARCGYHDDRPPRTKGAIAEVAKLATLARSGEEQLAAAKAAGLLHLPHDPGRAWTTFARMMREHEQTTDHPDLDRAWDVFAATCGLERERRVRETAELIRGFG